MTDGILRAGRRVGWGGGRPGSAYFVVLHKVHEGRALDLHRLSLPVVERQDKMKEVGFPQVRRRLLFEVGPGQGYSAAREETGGRQGKGERERGRRGVRPLLTVPKPRCNTVRRSSAQAPRPPGPFHVRLKSTPPRRSRGALVPPSRYTASQNPDTRLGLVSRCPAFRKSERRGLPHLRTRLPRLLLQPSAKAQSRDAT